MLQIISNSRQIRFILFYTIIRRRLNNIGVEENDAQRAKSKIVAEAFRGYTDLEVNNAFTLQFSKFNDAIKKVAKEKGITKNEVYMECVNENEGN